MGRFHLLAAFAVASCVAGSAFADTLISNFDGPFTTGSRYGALSAAGAVTSSATSVDVNASGFGGFFKDLPPIIDGTGEQVIEFDVTINAGDAPNVLAVLGDADFSEYAYRWFTLSAGQHTLQLPLSPVPNLVVGVGDSFVSGPGAVEGFNLSDIDYMHIQVDAHGSTVPYSISFNNLRLITVPEPTSLAALSLTTTLVSRRRR